MTIIDFMRQKLTEYPKISEFLVDGDIHVDFTEPGSSYGLSSNGDSLVKEDMLGNQTRLVNSNFLLELGYWLEQLPEEGGLIANIGNQEMEARFIKAITSNAMAVQPMGETVNDGILYQIQIQVTYQIESEE